MSPAGHGGASALAADLICWCSRDMSLTSLRHCRSDAPCPPAADPEQGDEVVIAAQSRLPGSCLPASRTRARMRAAARAGRGARRPGEAESVVVLQFAVLR